MTSSLSDSSKSQNNKSLGSDQKSTGELFINIEKDERRRNNSPAPRFITDSNAPPEVHRIVIEFNEKATDSKESEVDTLQLYK